MFIFQKIREALFNTTCSVWTPYKIIEDHGDIIWSDSEIPFQSQGICWINRSEGNAFLIIDFLGESFGDTIGGTKMVFNSVLFLTDVSVKRKEFIMLGKLEKPSDMTTKEWKKRIENDFLDYCKKMYHVYRNPKTPLLSPEHHKFDFYKQGFKYLKALHK
jgi:hypothetical protein